MFVCVFTHTKKDKWRNRPFKNPLFTFIEVYFAMCHYAVSVVLEVVSLTMYTL